MTFASRPGNILHGELAPFSARCASPSCRTACLPCGCSALWFGAQVRNRPALLGPTHSGWGPTFPGTHLLSASVPLTLPLAKQQPPDPDMCKCGLGCVGWILVICVLGLAFNVFIRFLPEESSSPKPGYFPWDLAAQGFIPLWHTATRGQPFHGSARADLGSGGLRSPSAAGTLLHGLRNSHLLVVRLLGSP